MPSASNVLRDIFTARAFDLEKVKTASAKNISKILEALMREIERELRDADPTGVTRTAYQKERLSKLFNFFNGYGYGFVDTTLNRHWVCSGSNIFYTETSDNLGEYRCGSSSITGNIACF